MCALSIISEKILFDRRRVVIHLLAVKFKCSRTGVVRPLERELIFTFFFWDGVLLFKRVNTRIYIKRHLDTE